MDNKTSDPNWRVIVDAIADPAAVIDQSGVVIHLNPLLADLFPRARVGYSVSLISREPALLKAIATARGGELRSIVQLHDRVPVERKLTAIITALGVDEFEFGKPAFLTVFRDLTDQERHAQLRADFVANASHELRTPLASLKLIVETLLGAGRDDTASKDRFLGMMAAQADRMTQLIDDLMSLNRVEMRAHLPPQDTVDIGELLAQVVQALEPLADSNGVNLALLPILDPIRVQGERDELNQVFLNLIQNGIRYGYEGSSVTIDIKQTHAPVGGSRTAISVADTGIGIAADHLPRLTERFYRVNASASRAKGGTGLGLAIVKHIVSRHRGELLVESELGKGAVFTVLLPTMPKPSVFDV
ncbi:MAG: two-component system phosphate regulon sensor histidine kinase PhoR [Hyphomicrobiaceae bacterium]